MSGFKYVEDPILGKGRAEFIGGGTGGESYVAGDGIAINGNTISTTGGGGGYADSAGFAFTAGELQSGATVNGATVTFSNIPQSAVTDLETALSGKSDIISGGYRIGVTSSGGSATVAQDKWFPITNVTGASVTMQPGEAYVIQVTTAAVTINTTTVPANQYGLESHLEIFVANTGYVMTGSNVVLANALEPDSVNNCTVRFHDGMAIISVEDHIAGYIVTASAGTTAGSLYYALGTASNSYIAVNGTLAGQTLDLDGVVTSAGEKHVVGNGYTETIVSGGITCTSKTTFANLTMSNVVNSGGTMTLGDVHIPSGATVSVSGGGLAVEKASVQGTIAPGTTTVVLSSGAIIDLTGNTNATVIGGTVSFPLSGATVVPSAGQASAYTLGGMVLPYIGNGSVNLGGSTLTLSSSTGSNSAIASGATFISGLLNIANTPFTFYPSDCVFSGAEIRTVGKGSLVASGCVFEGRDDRDLFFAAFVGTHKLTDCTIGICKMDQGANGTTLQLAGDCTAGLITSNGATGAGTVIISGGASIVLTSGIYARAIKVLNGGCTINGVSVSATGETPYSSIVSSGGSLYIDGQPIG